MSNAGSTIIVVELDAVQAFYADKLRRIAEETVRTELVRLQLSDHVRGSVYRTEA